MVREKGSNNNSHSDRTARSTRRIINLFRKRLNLFFGVAVALFVIRRENRTTESLMNEFQMNEIHKHQARQARPSGRKRGIDRKGGKTNKKGERTGK